MSDGVAHGCGSDPVSLLLWCRPLAIAPIQPQVWEPPYAVGSALKKKKKDNTVVPVMAGWKKI